MLQEPAEPQKSKPAADKKVVPAPLSAIRREAGKARAVVNHAGDRPKLKDALVAKVAAGYSKQRAAEIVAGYANAKNNPYEVRRSSL